ncbi:16926_t:CDS:2 [Funneliformis caledonium]|uniref:16926_t:CDS:1 n=1 Tax=Funneliformis caledonium TaxID=1117310 RepID=A0A9N9GKT3_9GLOM|nr:16926_t:CDS:2 [Funneliformis caledonium]
MSKKVDIIAILSQNYRECHEIIMNILKNDLHTLYSCIRVNRSFCRIFIPILWRNPFKFIKKDKKLVQLFNTLVRCLDPSIKAYLKLVGSTFFKYHTYIKEFELNPLQRAMELWTSANLLKEPNDSRSIRRTFNFNHYIGNLLFSKENKYHSLDVFYTELLSGPSSLFDICEFRNHKSSLINVNRLSLGFFNRSSMSLIPLITTNFLNLQNSLSPYLQHLHIFINTTKYHPEFSKNLVDFIQSQRHLKSLITNVSLIPEAFLNASKSLTFLRLVNFKIYTTALLSILNSLPNLITLELNLVPMNSDGDDSQKISTLPTSLFNNLKHLNYNYRITFLSKNSRALLKRLLSSTNNNLKSLKIKDIYCPLIREVQEQSHLNLTHFHLVIDHDYALVDLIVLLKDLHQLVHLKLNTISDRYYLSECGHLFREFTQSLARSLKILEVNFAMVDKNLRILLNESKFNIQCVKFYRYEAYKDTSLRILIDYAKRKKCLKEIGIPYFTRASYLSKECVKEAKNHFNITMCRLKLRIGTIEHNNPLCENCSLKKDTYYECIKTLSPKNLFFFQ